MSILNKKDNSTTTATEGSKTSQKSFTDQIVELLDLNSEFTKRLRAADRQVKRLNDRMSDLKEDGCETRALKRASADLSNLDIAALKADTSKLEDELGAAEIDIAKVTETSIRAYKRRSTKLQGELEETEEIIKEIDRVITAAEDKADDNGQPDATAEGLTVPETDEQQLSARMWALSMLSEYKADGCPKLKTPDGRDIVFALPVPRPSGTKYVRMDVKNPDTKDDLPDLVPGTMEKKKFVPIDGETASRAKAIVLLANSGKLW